MFVDGTGSAVYIGRGGSLSHNIASQVSVDSPARLRYSSLLLARQSI